MASQTQICNLAMMRLGEPSIMSIDDESKRAIALKYCWELVRDMVLQDHPWNFAIRRGTLARLSEDPAFGYSYAYQLPSNCLRVLGMVGEDENLDLTLDYKIEGQQLFTNEVAVKLKYILRITDTGLFTPRFCSALASRLAQEVSYHLVKSPALRKQMMTEYQQELSAAKAIDAQEDRPEVYQTNPWIEARA